MLKKISLLLVLLLVLGAFAVACGEESTDTTAGGSETTSGTPSGEVVTLKLQGAFPEGGAHYYYFDTFCEKVEEYSNGTLKVEWGAGPEGIPATELAEAMVNDTVQLVFTPFTYTVSHFPGGQVVKLMDPEKTRANGGLDYLNELTEKFINAHYLCRASDGTHFVAATMKEIKSLDDFKGMKLRASPAFQSLFTALGVGTVNMPLGEIYDAIERHVVDGAGLLLTDITDNSLQEVLKYVILPGVYTSDSSMMIALGAWNKLDQVQQDALSKAALDWEIDSKKYNTAINDEVMKTLTDAGVTIVELQGAEREQYLKLADDVIWEEVEGTQPEVAEGMKPFVD